MNATKWLIPFITALALVRPGWAQDFGDEPPVLGYPVEILVAAASSEAKGELIAVSADSVWLLRRAILRSYPLARVERATVETAPSRARTALVWSAVGGLLSGVALSAACSSLEDGDTCGGVFAAVLVSWGIVGGIAALTMGARHATLPSPTQAQLRPYARFPQGMPSDYRPGDR